MNMEPNGDDWHIEIQSPTEFVEYGDRSHLMFLHLVVKREQVVHSDQYQVWHCNIPINF